MNALPSPEPECETSPGLEAHGRRVPAVLRYLGKPDAPVQLEVLTRPRRERMLRAARAWGFCWLAAVGAVFIPLLHFVLVPALLLAGPLVARAKWQERVTVHRIHGTCPGCGRIVEDVLNSPAVAEIAWRCVACGRALRVHLDLALLDPEPAANGTRA